MKRIMIALFFLVATLGFTNVNAQQKPDAHDGRPRAPPGARQVGTLILLRRAEAGTFQPQGGALLHDGRAPP